MKSVQSHPDGGFSLIEVVVAIVMIFFFTTVSLQMLVVSSLFKRRAIQYTTASNLIQEDVEKIKSAADNYSFPKVGGAGAAINATSVTLQNTNGLANGNTIQFSNDYNTYTISAISGSTITIPALKKAVTTSETVMNYTSCTLTSTDTASTNKMATFFMNSLSTNATGIGSTAYSVNVSGNTSNYYAVTGTGITNPTPRNGQFYWLLRSQTVSSVGTDAPYNILQIRYVVQPGTSSAPTTTETPLATYYTEVIPYASLQCPSQ